MTNAELAMLHWYCFSFSHSSRESHGFASTYSGFAKESHFTKAEIDGQKRYACPDAESVVLIGISYLGFMTKAEFSPEAESIP